METKGRTVRLQLNNCRATGAHELPSDMEETGITFWTVGHSNRTLEDFLQLLGSAGIELLADVRRFPASRRHRQFSWSEMAATLDQRQIQYVHLPELGGRRRVTDTPAPSVWRNKSFKAYANFMKTGEFHAGIARLLSLATRHKTCIMCAEVLWWRCHRALIADYLKAAGHDVLHILSPTKVQPHPYTSAASIVGGELSYEPRDTATSALKWKRGNETGRDQQRIGGLQDPCGIAS